MKKETVKLTIKAEDGREIDCDIVFSKEKKGDITMQVKTQFNPMVSPKEGAYYIYVFNMLVKGLSGDNEPTYSIGNEEAEEA